MTHSSFIKCVFPEFTDDLDKRRMKIAAAANFVHSFDGAHTRAIVVNSIRKLQRRVVTRQFGLYTTIRNIPLTSK